MAFAALIGIVAGTSLLGITAARRTDSALDRFLVASRAADAGLFAFGLDPAPILRHSAVERAGLKAYLFIAYPDLIGNNASSFKSVDGVEFDSIDAGVVVAGRRARQDRPDEAVISPGLAARHGVRVGASLRGVLPTAKELERCFATGDCSASGAERHLTVVGIVRQPLDLAPQPEVESGAIWLTSDETVYLTSAFDGGAQELEPAVQVDLRRGVRDLEAVRTAAVAGAAPGSSVSTEVASRITASARRSLRTQAAADAALGVLAAAAGLAGVGQMLSREVNTTAAEWPALRSLGVRDRQLIGAAVLRLVPAVGLGAGLAVLAAYLGSAFTPFGPARTAEASRGLRFDGLALLLGSGVTVLVLFGLAAATAWWTCRRLRPSRRGATTLVDRPLGGRLPVPLAVGAHLARRTHGDGAHRPIRLSLATAGAGLVVVSGLLVVLASFDRLVTTPASYGWAGDLLVGNPNSGPIDTTVEPVLGSDPRVVGWSSATFLQLEVEGKRVPALAADIRNGQVLPTVVEGRAPAGPQEVALGQRTTRDLHVGVGDVVDVAGPVGTRSMQVVGTIVLGPPNGLAANVEVAGPGEGLLLQHAALDSLVTPGEQPRHVFFVDASPGADLLALAADLRQQLGPIVLAPVVSGDVLALQEVAWLPGAVAGVLLLLAAATLAQALTSTVRIRRRELGTLKAIGFSRRQLLSAVLVLGLLLVTAPLVVGTPVGMAGGRAAWTAVAEGLGVASRTTVPTGPLIAVGLGAIAAAATIAGLPGRWAARTPAAEVLRIE